MDFLGKPFIEKVGGEEMLRITSDDELMSIAAKLGIPLEIRSIDEEFPDCPNLIINSAEKHTGGRHWTARANREFHTFYFDPFGGSPDTRIIDKSRKPMIVSTTQHQDIDDDSCGIYCLCWLSRV